MITSGFFNSLNGDRKYDMTQLSDLFNSLIKDGIFASIGTAFAVSASSGNTVNIGIGRAWFNSTWVFNSAIELIDCGVSEVLLNRYDAVVIEIDRTNSVRSGTVKVVKGTPSSSPTKPVMIDTELKHQYPLAFILRKAGSEEIVQADIQSMIGTSSCPYVSGILETQNIDAVVAQWNAEFATWFANLHTQLDSDVAGHLQNQVDDIYSRIYLDAETLALWAKAGADVGNFLRTEYVNISANMIQNYCSLEIINEVTTSLIYGGVATPLGQILVAGTYRFDFFSKNFKFPVMVYTENDIEKEWESGTVLTFENDISLLRITCVGEKLPPGTYDWGAVIMKEGV